MFEAMLRLGATPVCEPVLGHVGDARPRSRRAGRRPRSAPAARPRRVPAVGGRMPGEHLGQLALAVARRRPRRRRSRRRAPRARRRAARRRRGRRRRVRPSSLEHDVADRARGSRRARRARRRGRPSAPRARARVASAVADGRDDRPPRSTVTRSATAITSWSLCEMKMIVRPSAAIARSVAKSPSRLLRRQHRRRLVEDQDARVAVERLEDLHPLLLADRELPDPRARVDRAGRSARRARRPRARSRRRSSRNERPASRWSPSTMFSATVNGSTSRKCWCTIPIPASSASRGEWQLDGPAVQLDLALVGPVEAGEDVRERRLAGAVLAEQRVHLAAADLEVDAVVRDDAGEPLRDPAHRDGRPPGEGGRLRARSRSSGCGGSRSGSARASPSGSRSTPLTSQSTVRIC